MPTVLLVARWSWTSGDRWPDQKAEESQIFVERAEFNRGSVTETEETPLIFELDHATSFLTGCRA